MTCFYDLFPNCQPYPQTRGYFCSGVSRPLRPRPSPDQTASDQQPAPGENPEPGEVNLAEISQPPQTNGELAEGPKQQQQRRQPRRRRQRNSESSTSKVGGCYVKVMKSPHCTGQPVICHFGFQNDTEKSASDPGTPPQTSKLGDLKSTPKSPKASSTFPKESHSPEVKRQGSLTVRRQVDVRWLSVAGVVG